MRSVETTEFRTRAVARVEPEIDRSARYAGDRSWVRGPTPPNCDILLDTTLTWMARLPKEMRPIELARRYPRIANHIADIWRRVARCEDYLDALLVDRRGNRTGFPPKIAQELNNLRGYYAELHPHNDNAGWNRVGAA